MYWPQGSVIQIAGIWAEALLAPFAYPVTQMFVARKIIASSSHFIV
jgi:hypothetical protein